ncbi:MAG: radical SAM protein [Candidatus Omnitrophica bacterium]|nr:radical SAM protein [Candidatus Omnitrophota bacterium]
MKSFFLVFSDSDGKIYTHPYLRMLGASGDDFTLISEEEAVRLPKGSSLFYLVGRFPVGFNPQTNRTEILTEFDGKAVCAVGAFLIPAYLRLHNPAVFLKKNIKLPLWAYTACGFSQGNFYASAVRIDKRVRQSPRFYDNKKVQKNINQFIAVAGSNRLYKHLANCAINYNCLAAKNLFLKRWEAPLPTATSCNARCLGCLSLQKGGECSSSHQRINFKPSSDEISQVMTNHLKVAKEAIVSFGQGCEGEPLLESKRIAKAIQKTRSITSRGTINVNTNASIPSSIKMLCEAGADSFRVSLSSAQEKFYNLYFRPCSYQFKDVMKSIKVAKKYNKFVSVNLFIFPGISDSESEVKALSRLIADSNIDMIQWRNLNIDPQYYLSNMPYKRLKPMGILPAIKFISKKFPHLKHGYFNLPKESL